MKSQLYFNLHNEKIPINIVRSRRKSLTLSLNAAGDITVKAPLYILQRDILHFINNQTNWITKKLILNRENIKHYSFTIGSSIPFLGQDILLVAAEHNKGIIYIDNQLLLPQKHQNIESILIKWYRDSAREKITQLVDFYTAKLGLTYNKIFIKAQKSRWGSCSSKGNLNFNWKIILTPPELIKYLIVHEVCHLAEMNHSNNFWNLVESHDPLYKINRKNLQKYGYYLLSFLE